MKQLIPKEYEKVFVDKFAVVDILKILKIF